MYAQAKKKFIHFKNNSCFSASSQWSTTGEREGQGLGEALRRGELLQATAGVVSGQTPRLDSAARTQQELLPRPLLWREDGTKPKCGAVL